MNKYQNLKEKKIITATKIRIRFIIILILKKITFKALLIFFYKKTRFVYFL